MLSIKEEDKLNRKNPSTIGRAIRGRGKRNHNRDGEGTNNSIGVVEKKFGKNNNTFRDRGSFGGKRSYRGGYKQRGGRSLLICFTCGTMGHRSFEYTTIHLCHHYALDLC